MVFSTFFDSSYKTGEFGQMSHCVSPCVARPLAQAHRPRFSRRQVLRIARLVAILLESAGGTVNCDVDGAVAEKMERMQKNEVVSPGRAGNARQRRSAVRAAKWHQEKEKEAQQQKQQHQRQQQQQQQQHEQKADPMDDAAQQTPTSAPQPAATGTGKRRAVAMEAATHGAATASGAVATVDKAAAMATHEPALGKQVQYSLRSGVMRPRAAQRAQATQHSAAYAATAVKGKGKSTSCAEYVYKALTRGERMLAAARGRAEDEGGES